MNEGNKNQFLDKVFESSKEASLLSENLLFAACVYVLLIIPDSELLVRVCFKIPAAITIFNLYVTDRSYARGLIENKYKSLTTVLNISRIIVIGFFVLGLILV